MKNNILITVFIAGSLVCMGQNQIDWSYPPLIAGSSWGNVFQRYFINGDYTTMLKLTSEESINKYGKDSILEYYREIQFSNPLKLKSWTKENKYYTLNYSTTIFATCVIIRMRLIEGDTAKLVLPADFKTQKYFLYK
jgi:hypothetical protein